MPLQQARRPARQNGRSSFPQHRDPDSSATGISRPAPEKLKKSHHANACQRAGNYAIPEYRSADTRFSTPPGEAGPARLPLPFQSTNDHILHP
jgi:hypothetical protein